jgi:hypothetical protein
MAVIIPVLSGCSHAFDVVFINTVIIIIIIIIIGWTIGLNSLVGIATRYRLEGPGFKSWRGSDFPHPSTPALGAHPASRTMSSGSLLWG